MAKGIADGILALFWWRGVNKCQLLLGAKGLHGFYAGGAACRDCAGQKRAEDEDSARGEDSAEVVAAGLVELRLKEASGDESCRYADEEADADLDSGSAKDETNNTGAIGAKRHAEADLRDAASDAVGGDSVEADGGEDEGDCAKDGGEADDEGLTGEVVADLLVVGGE